MNTPQLQHDGTFNLEVEVSTTAENGEAKKIKASAVVPLGANLDAAIAQHGETAVYKCYLAGAHADIVAEAQRALRGSIRPAVDPIKPKALQAHLDNYKLGTDKAEEAKLEKARAVLASLTEAQRSAILSA